MGQKEIREAIYNKFLIYVHDYTMMQMSAVFYLFSVSLNKVFDSKEKVTAIMLFSLVCVDLIVGLFTSIPTSGMTCGLLVYLLVKMFLIGREHFDIASKNTNIVGQLDYGIFYDIMTCFSVDRFGKYKKEDVFEKVKDLLKKPELTFEEFKKLYAYEVTLFGVLVFVTFVVLVIIFALISPNIITNTLILATGVLVACYKLWYVENGKVVAIGIFLGAFVFLIISIILPFVGSLLLNLVTSFYEMTILVFGIFVLMNNGEMLYGLINAEKEKVTMFYVYVGIGISVVLLIKGIVRMFVMKKKSKLKHVDYKAGN